MVNILAATSVVDLILRCPEGPRVPARAALVTCNSRAFRHQLHQIKNAPSTLPAKIAHAHGSPAVPP
jgi:hypothetical protein